MSTHDTADESDDQQPGAEARDLSRATGRIHPYHVKAAPKGYQLGEATQQARPHPPEYWKDDFHEMRMKFGIPPFDPEAYLEINKGCVVYPDVIRHRRNPKITPTPKGTDALIRAKKGEGKTTYLKNLAVRLGENNRERIVHRGRTGDSGWLELRWWATLWLPENASVKAQWVYEEGEDESREPVDDLEDVVREVRTYGDVYGLVDTLAETPIPSYHVVYPDPSFAGCERVMRETNKTGQVLPYTPEWEADEGQSPTPLPQWWIAFLVCQIEHGHFDAFMSWLCDEAQQVFGPANPSADDHLTDKKFDLAGQLLNAARKRMLSWYLATQSEGKIDYRILDEVTHRIYLADGRPNPYKKNGATIPYGWKIVPMDVDFMSGKPKGRGLCFVEAPQSGYAEFMWNDFEPHPDDENRWLEIRLGEPQELVRSAGTGQEVPDRAALEYDERLFEHHEPTNHLYVRAPGEGKIDLAEPAIVDDLVSPPVDGFEQLESLAFPDELRRDEAGDYWIVAGEVGVSDGNGGVRTAETTLVRIPVGGHYPGDKSEGRQ